MKEGRPPLLYEVVIKALLSESAKEEYIQRVLIPSIDRLYHRKSLSFEEIRDKFLSSKNGNLVEVLELIKKGDLNEKLTPQLALGIADLVFYSLQLKCPFSLRDKIHELVEDQISWALACDFCIIKYDTLLYFGEGEETEALEASIRYLDRLLEKSKSFKELV